MIPAKYTTCHRSATPFPAVELLADRARMPWPARHLARRHGLHAATARTVAELIGYTLEAR
jgi:hypothetical protein